MGTHRLALMLAGLLTAVTACSASGGGTEPAGPAATGEVVTVTQVEPGPRERGPSALENRSDKRFPDPLIDPDDIMSGGPAPDGIPPIDEPAFERARTVEWLGDGEAVLSLTVEGETRAYPLQVMTWHEIVNDTVGGVPVAVTYCPLCNSGVAFEREVGDRVFSFGASGMLYADNLVMYDRQTESLWPQLTGQASVGVLTGTKLVAIPMGTVSWSEFRMANPDALVLSRDTGFERPYGRNPYEGYDDPEGGLLFDLPGKPDDRLAVKERVIGIGDTGDSVAVVRDSLVDRPPQELELDGRPVVLLHRPGQVSALGGREISGGADIGTVGVYDPVLDGRHLHFVADADGFRDQETGSTWDVLGRARTGPLEGKSLEPVRHLDTFWFAWVTFHPETALLRAPFEDQQ